MGDQSQHEMQLRKTHPSGAEEWACPTCARRFVMQWPPACKRIILNAGDEVAVHVCNKGGLSVSVTPTTSEEQVADDFEARNQWTQWLSDIDFGDWE